MLAQPLEVHIDCMPGLDDGCTLLCSRCDKSKGGACAMIAAELPGFYNCA